MGLERRTETRENRCVNFSAEMPTPTRRACILMTTSAQCSCRMIGIELKPNMPKSRSEIVWPVSALQTPFNPLAMLCLIVSVLSCVTTMCFGGTIASASDRTGYYFPLPAKSVAVIEADRAAGTSEGSQPAVTDFVTADAAFGAGGGRSWAAYSQLWRAHHDNPAGPAIRKFLSLPSDVAIETKLRRGRSAPKWLGWRSGSYNQVDTPHFQIFSRAEDEASRAVAEDLERCYWIWTQAFFPFWEGREQVALALRGLAPDADVETFLAASGGRLTVRRKLRVVLFKDAAQYVATLRESMPGIERSTGFYSDDQRIAFFYANSSGDVATRRHELTHQLFREATRSKLGSSMPGEKSGFWLAEGIAGYTESMKLAATTATLGGWDSPRLQFARFRILSSGDSMPLSELVDDGRIAAQQRSDLARWYAHSIAQTHRLMDGADFADRVWVYKQLAEMYRVELRISPSRQPDPSTRSMDAFLRITDDHLNANPVQAPIRQLCLSGCEVTSGGLGTLPPSSGLQWLDLSRLPIENADVLRLISDPSGLTQLSLEATKITSGITPLVARCVAIEELDLSFTGIGDSTIKAIPPAAPLDTLWLTGSLVSDKAIEKIASIKSLTAVDLQRTQVTEDGILRLRQLRPDLNVNPLELRGAAK